MRFIIALAVLFSLNSFIIKANDVDSLLRILDLTIVEKEIFNKRWKSSIDSLEMLLITTNNLEERYAIYQKQFKQYRHYNMDTALIIANKKLSIAKTINNKELIVSSEMNIAEILGIMGLYKEALDIVNEVDRKTLTKDQLPYYYHVYHSTYSLIEQSTFSKKEKESYQKLISQYKDSLLQVNEPNTLTYNLIKNGKLLDEGKYKEALTLMQECYSDNNNNKLQLGSIAYGLSCIYEKLGDRQQQKKYLAISAITDLQKVSKSYIALRKLAILLYEDGDINHAYNYIQCTMEDAIFCKARFRTLEISEALPIILAAYDQKMKNEKSNLIKSIILISILSSILIFSIVFIYRQLKRLSAARKSLNKMYDDVKLMNNEIKSMNSELTDLNAKLLESNQVKEVYIGSIFNLCSTYIDKMESYRINLKRKLKSGQIEDALKITSSPSLVSDEMKEFFRNFDAIFLNIYPNFVEEFNSLLKSGEEITPKGGDILTPELRVFALVRLGINDCSKIANIFHYSPQTVYNYKLKIRNKLTISKEEFAIAIQRIGK